MTVIYTIAIALSKTDRKQVCADPRVIGRGSPNLGVYTEALQNVQADTMMENRPRRRIGPVI